MPSWQSALFSKLDRVSAPRNVSHDTPVEELRAAYDRLTARFGQIPREAEFEEARLGPIRGEWVRGEGTGTGRVILYFHGGFHIAGTPEAHRPLIARLALAAGAVAFAPNYRKAPEFPFPAAVRDGIDAYRQLLAKGIPPQSIVLAGDGSGGGLAFSCALALRNADLPMPAAIAAMSPWADMALSGWSMLERARNDNALSFELLFVAARHYLRRNSPADPYASPIYASLKGFPPIMVHAGSEEMLRDDASRLGDLAAAAGIPVSVEIYDGMQHVFQASSLVPEARTSLLRLGQFIRGKAASAPAGQDLAVSG